MIRNAAIKKRVKKKILFTCYEMREKKIADNPEKTPQKTMNDLTCYYFTMINSFNNRKK